MIFRGASSIFYVGSLSLIIIIEMEKKVNVYTNKRHDKRMNDYPLSILFLLYFIFVDRVHNTNLFFLIDSLCLVICAGFKILRLHFLMIFKFCAASLSIVVFASSRKVTSRYQCMLSILQCPLTARLTCRIFCPQTANEITILYGCIAFLLLGFLFHYDAGQSFPLLFLA